jgi:Protein of unknown function (DUF2975)
MDGPVFLKRIRSYVMDTTRRITVISRRLKLTCTGLIFCLPVLCAIFWALFNEIYAMVPMISLPVRLGHELPAHTRIFAFLTDLLPLSVTIYALMKLKVLFALYESGHIFTEDNVRCFRSLGRALMIWVACDIVSRSLLGIVLTLDNPPGKRLLVLGMDGGDFTGLFVGTVVLIISWVMEEARKMQEDHPQSGCHARKA